MTDPQNSGDPFLVRYDRSELRIASEFLSNWLPFLSRDLCLHCTHTLSHRIHSLSPKLHDSKEPCNSEENSTILMPDNEDEDIDNCDTHSLGSWKGEAEAEAEADLNSCASNCGLESPVADASPREVINNWIPTESETRVRMSWADMAQEDELEGEGESEENRPEGNEDVPNGELGGMAKKKTELLREVINNWIPTESGTRVRMSWADMAQEDELEGEGESEENRPEGNEDVQMGGMAKKKTELSRDQREYLRFKNVRRKKDFICLERVDGKLTNILQGLELHTGVFSAVEQKRIVDNIYDLVEKGKKGKLKERTYTAPRKWMKGKGRVTIQFGCCYNYATDKKGNPPGILKHEEVDPLPSLFRVIIKRLISWHVLPPSCVPDSCIVNIYEEGDCIPPHIDNHDFVRPFCTISFLSECNIVFGTDLKIEGAGEFSGSIAIPLPVGSVMVLSGNGADVAKHCIPAVPSKRISITFRRMDESKRPVYYAPEPDLQGLEPLCYDDAGAKQSPSPHHVGRQGTRSGFRSERKRDEEPRYSARSRVTSRGPRTRVNIGGS